MSVRVGFFSPLPPERTGVADYAGALLAALRKRGKVDVNALSADIRLYHLGNNQLHRRIYEQALTHPGAVVLHDAVLHHFFLGSLDERAYIAEFVHNYGEWSRDLARQLWKNRARSGTDRRYFDYPMLKRIAGTAKLIIVHNPAAARIVKEHGPQANVVEIPHLVVPPPLPSRAETLRLRHELGISSGALLVGVFGHLRESKRLPAVLDAVEQARAMSIDISLLIAGEFVSTGLARALEPRLNAPHIVRIGYTPEREFWRYAAMVDACVNLRYPSAGETSGIAVRLMGIGKPLMLTDGEEISAFPECACLRVDAGLTETAMLAEYLVFLARFPESAREIGRRAAAHIAAHHSVDLAAQQYWQALYAIRPR